MTNIVKGVIIVGSVVLDMRKNAKRVVKQTHTISLLFPSFQGSQQCCGSRNTRT